MKPEHLKLVKANLPGLVPKLNQVLIDHGLHDFLIKNLEIIHTEEDPCKGRCTAGQKCVQVLVNGKFQWACRPKNIGNPD